MPGTREEIRFSALCKKFLSRRDLTCSPQTVLSEKYKARQLEKRLGNLVVSSILTQHITDSRDHRLREGVSQRSANLELIFVRCLLNFSVEQGHAEHNPAKGIKLLREVRRDKPTPSDEQLQRLLAEAESTTVGRQSSSGCCCSRSPACGRPRPSTSNGATSIWTRAGCLCAPSRPIRSRRADSVSSRSTRGCYPSSKSGDNHGRSSSQPTRRAGRTTGSSSIHDGRTSGSRPSRRPLRTHASVPALMAWSSRPTRCATASSARPSWPAWTCLRSRNGPVIPART